MAIRRFFRFINPLLFPINIWGFRVENSVLIELIDQAVPFPIFKISCIMNFPRFVLFFHDSVGDLAFGFKESPIPGIIRAKFLFGDFFSTDIKSFQLNVWCFGNHLGFHGHFISVD